MELWRVLSNMVTIYGLRLESGKFYVGMTMKNFDRIDSHRKGAGAAWTKMYPPVDYEFVKTGMKKSDEDRLTLELMSIHGIDNVRGGKWVRINLPKEEYENLQKLVKSSFGPSDISEKQIAPILTTGERYALRSERVDGDRFEKWIRIYHTRSY